MSAAFDKVIHDPHTVASGRPAADFRGGSVLRVQVGQLFDLGLAGNTVVGEILLEHLLGGDDAPATIRAGNRSSANGHQRVGLALNHQQGDRMAGLERGSDRLGQAADHRRDPREQVGRLRGQVMREDAAVGNTVAKMRERSIGYRFSKSSTMARTNLTSSTFSVCAGILAA